MRVQTNDECRHYHYEILLVFNISAKHLSTNQKPHFAHHAKWHMSY